MCLILIWKKLLFTSTSGLVVRISLLGLSARTEVIFILPELFIIILVKSFFETEVLPLTDLDRRDSPFYFAGFGLK